jgi:hypothetical protein
MKHSLTDDEVRVLYQDKQKEPFSKGKRITGAVYGIILIASMIALYAGVWALIIKNFSK